MQPVSGNVLIRPVLRSQTRAAEVKKRSGLLLARPQNKKSDFEGLPNRGIVHALPPGYEGPLRTGVEVVFIEGNPRGFVLPGDPHTKLFKLKLDQVIAQIKS